MQMKTNIIMKSVDRNLLGQIIRQETKTKFLNISDLQSLYNQFALKEGLKKRRIDMILTQSEHYERIFYLLEKQGLINASILAFIELIKDHGIITTLKKLKVFKTTGARHTKTSWANPYIWMLIAMELHPKIYAYAVSWVTDELLINRIESGDFYKELTDSIKNKLTDEIDYKKLAIGLNHIIFKQHKPGIRNTGSRKQLSELKEIEKKFAWAINQGYIKSFEQLINEMRKMYKSKSIK